MGQFKSLSQARRMATQLSVPINRIERYAPFMQTHTYEGSYSQSAAISTLLYCLASDIGAAIMATLPERQSWTLKEIHQEMVSALRNTQQEYRTGDASTAVNRSTIENYLLHYDLAATTYNLFTMGLIQRESLASGSKGEIRYSATPFTTDLVRPLAWSAINFVNRAMRCGVAHESDSLSKLLGLKRDNLAVYHTVKLLVKAEQLTRGEIEALVKVEYPTASSHSIRTVIDALVRAKAVDYASINKGGKHKPPHGHLVYTPERVGMARDDLAIRVKRRAYHRLKLAHCLAVIDFIKSGSEKKKEYTTEEIASFLEKEFQLSKSYAQQCAREIMQGAKELGFLGTKEGLSGERRAVLKANRVTHLLYDMVLQPAADIACTLTRANLPPLRKMKEKRRKLGLFLRNYNQENRRANIGRTVPVPNIASVIRKEESQPVVATPLAQSA